VAVICIGEGKSGVTGENHWPTENHWQISGENHRPTESHW
jgi:hypothetical protein